MPPTSPILVQDRPSETFTKIRNFLAGRHIGATNDADLLDQVLLCLFAKLYIIHHEKRAEMETRKGLKVLYLEALNDLHRSLGPAGTSDTKLLLDSECLHFIDTELNNLDLISHDSDLVGDAYQCFRGSEMRGQEGQFFTPTAAIRVLISIIDPKPGEKIIDPACGAGGFLFASARHLMSKGARPSILQSTIVGIDKDAYLARLARMRVSLLTLRQTAVTIGDSLAWTSSERGSFINKNDPGGFDVVLTNPPFGTKIVAASERVRKQFTLAHRWALTEKGQLRVQDALLPNSPPQVLFIERCVSLLKPGGRIGMVVPESLVSGRNYRNVVEYIREKTEVETVIGMPEALFKTSGKGGTHTKTVLLVLRKPKSGTVRSDHKIFMAEATWCGHDSRGRSVPKDDTLKIVEAYRSWKKDPGNFQSTPLGAIIASSSIRNGVLAPRSYDPGLDEDLCSLRHSHDLIKFGDLVKSGALTITTGNEVGKLAYGTGDIPFVRTSDLSNWEVKIDPKHGISEELYEQYREKQNVQANDVLMVRDGTYLVGTCAIVTPYDTKIVFQSHIYKIRVSNSFDPYYLLAVLSSEIVQRQIRAFTQTQDIINSLGSRINDLLLPVPKDKKAITEVSNVVKKVIADRVEARELVRKLLERVGVQSPKRDTDLPSQAKKLLPSSAGILPSR